MVNWHALTLKTEHSLSLAMADKPKSKAFAPSLPMELVDKIVNLVLVSNDDSPLDLDRTWVDRSILQPLWAISSKQALRSMVVAYH